MSKTVLEIREPVELDEAAPKISTGKSKGNITANGLRGKGMKKFDISVKVVNGKFEFRITDEQGKFQTVGLKQAARMLGESTVNGLVEEVELDEGIEQTMIRMLHSKFQELSKVIDPKSATAKKISAKLGVKSEFSEIKGYMNKIEDILRELDSMASMNESAKDESTAAYGKSQEKIANDKKKANIKPGELNKLAKIRAMLDKEKKKK